ncbi:CBO0543 family protein [Paenibacillus sp. HWE-109]|uniref:CBO0543 family protein n=1 Tax=Paenibacillus sp. HWE-109 TaxID=1306526 RepID=UPI003FCDA4AB
MVSFWVLAAAWRWGDWKDFKAYYPTMLYISCLKLLYELFSHEVHYEWHLEPDFFLNYTGTIMLHTFFIYPLSAFIFLSTFPKLANISKCVHILKWTLIYFIVEALAYKTGRITYHDSWSLWWSLVFDLNMFLMLRLHYTHFIWSIPLSCLCTFFYLLYFGYLL